MTRRGRITAEFRAAWIAFIRRRTAVFFTFFFPAILIVIFGALVGTQAAGLFSEPAAYYVPGYLAVVVLFTPLSRISSSVTRHRDGNRFEKLATTPLAPIEWLLAHTLVNVILVGIASILVVVLVILLAGARFDLSPALIPFIALGVALFCGVGALIGRFAGSQDGAIAASNAIGLPLLFLSETFVPPGLLPKWFQPIIALSPLTYFARGTRAAIMSAEWVTALGVLLVVSIVAFAAGAWALPWRS